MGVKLINIRKINKLNQDKLVITGHTPVKAGSAAGFINVFFSQQNLVFYLCPAERIGGGIAAAGAYGMELCDKLSPGQQGRNRAKGLAHKIHVEACNNNPHSLQYEVFQHLHNAIVKELRFIYAHYVNIRS